MDELRDRIQRMFSVDFEISRNGENCRAGELDSVPGATSLQETWGCVRDLVNDCKEDGLILRARGPKPERFQKENKSSLEVAVTRGPAARPGFLAYGSKTWTTGGVHDTSSSEDIRFP